MNFLKSLAGPVLAVLVLSTMGFLLVTQEVEENPELTRVKELTEELLTKVSEVTGLEIKHPVNVNIIDKAGLKDFLLQMLEEEYPGDLLERQAEAFSTFGLLPEDYDIRAGLVDLMTEQAAAFYDPRTKTYYAITDLPEQLKVPFVERMLAAHELTHALQDQALGLKEMTDAIKKDSDKTYSIQSLMEGQAVIAMYVVTMGANVAKMPDFGQTMRASMTQMSGAAEMKVLSEVPVYLRETLISPYAEGSSFVQNFLRENPDSKISELLKRIPPSGEQILHYDKYVENDRPRYLELDAFVQAMPEGWELLHEGNLGEFDVRVLFSLIEETKENNEAIAAGWDGLQFAVFKSNDQKVLGGASVWDSETDATEFGDALKIALEAKYGQGRFSITSDGERVSFLAGDFSNLNNESLLSLLHSAPATEE